MKKELDIAFEKGVRLLSLHMPPAEQMRKPTLFHGIRVGVFLYQHHYSDDVVLAGLLHDALEFTDITEEMLRREFSDRVATLVKACTKDDSIADPQEKTNELIQRCVQNGKDALVVKTADILDSFQYYTDALDEKQLEYCNRNAKAIFQYKPEDFADQIFDVLRKWHRSSL